MIRPLKDYFPVLLLELASLIMIEGFLFPMPNILNLGLGIFFNMVITDRLSCKFDYASWIVFRESFRLPPCVPVGAARVQDWRNTKYGRHCAGLAAAVPVDGDCSKRSLQWVSK